LITFLSNPVERVFLAPLNMNYHAAHHLWPSIPYYNLARADCEIRNLPAAAGLEWRGSYTGYLLRYFRLLPLGDCKHARGAGV
jgi:fatty acid desaturase